MPHIHSKRTGSATAVLVLLLVAVLLAGCGSSSKSSSSTSTNASASKSTTGAPRGAAAGRFAALRECLKKNGITLHRFTPGQRPAPGSPPGGAVGLQRPKGMTQAQYEAILKKCGSGFTGAFNGVGSRFRTPAVTRALAKFATCMRENGVNIPAPNTSGKGPIFNSKGLDTSSATFKAADAKCRSQLEGAFRAHPGGAGAPGAPPAGGSPG